MLAADSDTKDSGPAAPEGSLALCPHSASCAGCPYLELAYDEQLRRKGERVREAMARHAELAAVTTEPCIAAEPRVGYRSRAKLMVAPGPRIGLYGRHQRHVVVDVPHCIVLSPVLREVADVLRQLLAESSAPALKPFDPETNEGALVAVDLREVWNDEGSAGVLVTLVLDAESVPPRAVLEEAAEAIRAASHRVLGVAANFRPRLSPQVLGPETHVLSGVSHAPDKLGSVFHLASYGSFVQAHRGQATRIRELLVRELSGEEVRDLRGKRILELYGGSGAIGLALAAHGAEVVMVESFSPAAESARRAAAQQNLASFRALSADAAQAAAQLAAQGERFDAVIVNPPRRGLAPEVRIALARLAPQVLAYISCDPDTLGRDLGHFARLGYTTSRIQPFDMIPMTEEVESVTVLRPGRRLPPTVVFEDDDVFVIDKPPHEPTTPQGEHAGSLLERVRSELGFPNATPVHRLDLGTSGLVVIAKHPKAVTPWRQALASASARKIYLAAVKGITSSKGTVARPLRDAGRSLSARTRYRRLAVLAGHSLLRVLPEEGRTHQIRRHLSGIGHPVLGDERYGHQPSNRHFFEKYGLDRTFLHCVRLELTHPHSGASLILESPLPGDLRSVLERTGGKDEALRLQDRKSLGG